MTDYNRFLAEVARFYFEFPQVGLSCLIFPNKRSAIYFRRYFKALVAKHHKSAVIAPATTTIGAFLEQHSELEGVSNVEALFVLYDVYRRVAHQRGADIMDFDRFVFWGRMLINDFEDIDAALADAKALYKNLSDLKEISSNFLTEDQLQVLQYVFGKNMAEHYRAGDTGRFWRHISDDDDNSSAHARFVELWMLLGDIYTQYRKSLVDMGRAYPSLMARNVCEQLANGTFVTPFAHIAFVGFNAPSVAVMRIMQLLDRMGRAQFFWDVLPRDVMSQRAGRRVAHLAARFKMPDEFTPPAIHRPVVDVRAIPSDSMQAKEAIARLYALKKNDALTTRRPDNTAVVLPDANLLPDLLQSMPDDFGQLNITMGLPMRNTFFASVMRNIVSLQINVDVRRGLPVYRSEDVRAIVSNPRLLSVAHSACRAVLEWLDKKHSYMVSANDLVALEGVEALRPIFEVFDDNNATEVHGFFDNVIAIFEGVNSDSVIDRHEQLVVQAWRDALNNVLDLSSRYRIETLGRNAFFSLLWRIISSDEMHISGSPVTGLQVMGMLETRNLDFDNVIVLSVNENVCPPRHGRRTFIPAMLRRSFALPVDEDYALEYDYYFYRLLSRSQSVTFVYDSRASTRRNARSHLIDQMIFMHPDDLKMTITPVHSVPSVPQKRVFSVAKTDEVMRQVDRLREFNSGVNLSASALKVYRKCPLKFYLSTVCGIRENEEVDDFMSYATYGTVVHKVLEDIFVGMRTGNADPSQPAEVTAEKLVVASNYDSLLRRVQRTINKIYHHGHFAEHELDNLPGESRLLALMMTDYITKVLEKELETVKEKGPFLFVAAEETYKSKNDDKGQPIGKQLDLGGDLKVNFSMSIDRHDILSDGSHRFVDYKTGSDKSVMKSLADIFDRNSDGNDAALQLLIYAEAYLANHPDFDGRIVPALYKLQKAFTDDFQDDIISIRSGKGKTRIDKQMIWSLTADWRGELQQRLRDMVAEIFDREVPFGQAKDAKNCKYCPFIDMCMRTPSEY